MKSKSPRLINRDMARVIGINANNEPTGKKSPITEAKPIESVI